jgi:hypothetical protein
MRFVWVAAVLVASCLPSSSKGGGDCQTDTDCLGTEVCARDGECWPASSVRSVNVTWTIDGEAASVETCGAFADLYIRFFSPSDEVGYSPVPCRTGLFPIVNLPDTFVDVELGAEGAWSRMQRIDAQNLAAFDLTF